MPNQTTNPEHPIPPSSRSDMAFAHVIAAVVKRRGFEIEGKVRNSSFVVPLGPGTFESIGVVATSLDSKAGSQRTAALVGVVRRQAKKSLDHVVVVRPKVRDEETRKSLEAQFGTTVVSASEIANYLGAQRKKRKAEVEARDFNRLVHNTVRDAGMEITTYASEGFIVEAAPERYVGIVPNADVAQVTRQVRFFEAYRPRVDGVVVVVEDERGLRIVDRVAVCHE